METLGFITTHLPYWFYLGAMGVFDIVKHLPWPTPADIFKGVVGSFISFLVLWKPRDIAERRWFRRRLGRRKASRPPDHSDTQAAAAVSSLFEHH